MLNTKNILKERQKKGSKSQRIVKKAFKFNQFLVVAGFEILFVLFQRM